MEMIVDNAITKAKFDKTIQAIILSCEDEAKGQYKCKYQDSIFYAYASSPLSIYKKNANVYILVPKGDMTETKTILGTVDKLGADYINQLPSAAYHIIGNNGIINGSQEFGLNSTKKQKNNKQYDEIILYSKDEPSLLSINDNFKAYILQSDALKLSMNIRTALPSNQILTQVGDYGVEIIANFKKNDIEFSRTYKFNSVDINGNVFKMSIPVLQNKYFACPEASDFLNIQKISIYAQDFPVEVEKNISTIFFSNICLEAASAFTEAELNGYTLSIETPNGTAFSRFDTNKKLKAKVYSRGREIDIPNNAKIYWFIEDAKIGIANDNYEAAGGEGWRKINEGSVEITLDKEIIPTDTACIKCIVVLSDSLIQRIVTMQNQNQQPLIEVIIQDNKTPQLYQNQGYRTLQCLSKASEFQPDNFIWKKIDNNGTETILTENGDSLTIEASSIQEYATYKCFAYQGEEYIGSGEQTLYNNQEVTMDYRVEIANGDQVFIYDENGYSPSGHHQVQQQKILPLQLIIYDKQGNNITEEALQEIAEDEIKWEITGAGNSLVTLEDKKTHGEINFTIAEIYNYSKRDNTIKVSFPFRGIGLVATTNLVFLKTGDPGTNGTSTIVQIVPNTKDDFDGVPALVYTNGKNPHWNFLDNQENPFSVKVYKDGVEVTQKSFYYSWSVLKDFNKTGHLSISQGKITAIKTWNENYIGDILKVTVTFNRLKYYAVYPVIVMNINSGKEPKILQYGFNSILYSSSGTNPSYDMTTPFEIEEGATDYSWSTCGSLESRKQEKDSQHNSFFASPTDTYDKFNIDNKVICTITREPQKDYIWFPIVMEINRYGMMDINEWQSGTVEVGDASILSPMIGAGRKNESNQFTGIVIGESKQSGKDNEIGLFGYHAGERSIFLDANSGKAEFGSSSKIIIDPSEDSAVIKSGNYKEKDGVSEKIGSGLEIVLEAPDTKDESGNVIQHNSPWIRYGSKNFMVNPNGELIASNATISGRLTSDGGELKELTLTGALLTKGGALWGYDYSEETDLPNSKHKYISFGQGYANMTGRQQEIIDGTGGCFNTYDDPGLQDPDGKIYFGTATQLYQPFDFNGQKYYTNGHMRKNSTDPTDVDSGFPFYFRDPPHSWIDGTAGYNKDMEIHTDNKLILEGADIQLKYQTTETQPIPSIMKQIGNFIYPVGSLYTSLNPTNPVNLFGGQWTQITDAFIYAAKGNEILTGNKIANSMTVSGQTDDHALTVKEMPTHSHNVTIASHGNSNIFKGDSLEWGFGENDNTFSYTTSATGNQQGHSHTISQQKVNGLPEHIEAYVWRRTSLADI